MAAESIDHLRATEEELAKTSVRSTLVIEPVKNIVGDVAGVLGEHLLISLRGSGLGHSRSST